MNIKPIRVLFLCTGNSARSIIAEALLKEAGGEAFKVFSAGTHPRGLNPFAIKVLEQEGVGTSGLYSKDVSEFLDRQFDYVITLCDEAAEECPFFPGARKQLHWSLPNPAAASGSDAEKLAAFRTTLMQIRQRLNSFLTAAPPSPLDQAKG